MPATGGRCQFAADPALDLTTPALGAARRRRGRRSRPPGHYVVEPATVDPGVLATVTAWCAAQHVMPQGLTVGRRSLEDVFLDLTGRSLR